MQKEKRSPWYMITVVGSIGTEIVLLILLFVWLGKKLDSIFHTQPVLLVIGVFLGLIAGFASAALTYKALLKE